MTRSRQHGYVLLALLLVVFVSGSSLFLGSLNNRQQIANAQQSETVYQLMKAKEALLAFAANSATIYSDSWTPGGPGYFPCPDTDNNGVAQSGCNSNQPVIGRLPEFVNIQMPPPLPDKRYSLYQDQPGPTGRFWYVVAPRHVRHGSASMRQSRHRTSAQAAEANLRMSLDGTGNHVALIIAPGEALLGQDRIASPNSLSSYLESQDSVDPFTFVSSNGTGPQVYNDVVVGITHDEYMEHMGATMSGIVKSRLSSYHEDNGTYPDGYMSWFGENIVHEDFLAALGAGWIADEGWNSNSLPIPEFCSFFPWPFACTPTLGYRKMNRMFFTEESPNSFKLRFFGCNQAFEITTQTGYQLDPEGCL